MHFVPRNLYSVTGKANSQCYTSILTQNYPDANDPETLYFSDIYGRNQILKTTDGGATLTELTPGTILERDKQISQVAIHNGTGDTLYCSTGEGPEHGRVGNGIFRSLDGGSTWNYSGLQGFSTPCIETMSNGRVFAGTFEEGLYYSDDAGVTWTLHPDLPDTTLVLEIDKRDSVIVVSGADDGVFLSTDWGDNFFNIGRVGEYNFDIAISHIDPDIKIYVSGFSQPAKYNSASGIWTAITDPLLDDHIVMGIGAQENNVYMCRFINSKIVVSTDDGSSYNELSNNPSAAEIRSLVVNYNDDAYMYAAIQHSYSFDPTVYQYPGISRSTDGGITWEYTGPEAHGMSLAMDPVNPDVIYFSTFSDGLYKTEDGFDTWTSIRSTNRLVFDVTINPGNSDEILISEYDLLGFTFGLLKSTDAGGSWTSVSSDILGASIEYSTINNNVYVATENGIHLSSDNGDSWSSTPDFLSGENVTALHFYDSLLYVGTEEGELLTIDELGAVTSLTVPWNSTLPTEVKNIYTSSEAIFVGLNGAEQDTLHSLNGDIWFSTDKGVTWELLTGDLTNSNVFGLNVIAEDNSNRLLVGTYGGGIFRSNAAILEVPEIKEEEVISIYPNPGRESINLQIPPEYINNGFEVEIYNSVGQLVFKNKNALTIQTGDFPKGVYSMIVTAEEMIETTSFVIH